MACQQLLRVAAVPVRRAAAVATEEPEEEEEEEVAGSEAVAAEPASEAVAHSGDAQAELARQQQQQQLVSEEVEEVVEQEVEPFTVQLLARNVSSWATTTTPGKLTIFAVVALFAGSLALAAYRAWQKANTGRAKRIRQIDRNRELVDGLNAYLPNNRAGLTASVIKGLQRNSGFTPVEVFRKYLWYLLRERRFDQGAVDDLVQLKTGLGLSDADAGEALRERSQRVYDKYGSLMLNTEGMTLAGAQRKATCTALFRKVLYLAEFERLVGPAALGSGEQVTDIRKIFGATEEDLDRLRIKNLYEEEVDLESAMALDAEDGDDKDQKQDEGPSTAGPRTA